MSSWMAISYQDSSSYLMQEMGMFYDYVVVIMTGIIIFIVYLIFFLLIGDKYYKNLSEGTFVEIVWSLVPAVLLVTLVFPSMKVLYLMEDVKFPTLSFKVVGHQWYWSFVVPLYKNFFFKFFDNIFSFYDYDMMMDSDEENSFRLLNCSSSLVLPIGIGSRFLISSADVIHSFSLPSLGLKVDAVPGRLNQLVSYPLRLGVFYGQCSEICGANHSFMPIEVKVVDISSYDNYCRYLLLSMIDDASF